MSNTSGRSTVEAGAAAGLPSELLELGRSMLRFSWAMTVFGAQQAANLVTTSASGQPAAAGQAFDAVANAVEEQFGGVFRGAYRTGREYLPGVGRERPGVADSKG